MTPKELAAYIEDSNVGAMGGPGLSRRQIDLLATVESKRMVCAALRACETAREELTFIALECDGAVNDPMWDVGEAEAGFKRLAQHARAALAELEKVTHAL